MSWSADIIPFSFHKPSSSTALDRRQLPTSSYTSPPTVSLAYLTSYSTLDYILDYTLGSAEPILSPLFSFSASSRVSHSLSSSHVFPSAQSRPRTMSTSTLPSPPSNRRNYDVIVVGAGIAGSYVLFICSMCLS